VGKISDALKKIAKIREEQRKVQEPQRSDSNTYSNFAKMIFDTKRDLTPNIATKEPPKIEPLTLTERLGLKEKLFVVGEKDSSGIDPRVVTYYDYFSLVSEQYRLLRTSIKTTLNKLKTSSKDNGFKNTSSPCIFTITSALHNEGKTLTATNLAVALAHDLEGKVLLVDCDLRKSSVHRMLNVELSPGLSDVLTSEIDPCSVIVPTKISNLFVMPSGKSPLNPSELLGSKKMRLVIERLKVQPFTHIILDTPPLLPFTDGALLGAQSQGVFMVVQANRTQIPVIEKAKVVLEQGHSKLLGFILTQVDSYAFNSYGYNYYYYYKNKSKN
jgi:capsular exopolysaccharide synthesis family protein